MSVVWTRAGIVENDPWITGEGGSLLLSLEEAQADNFSNSPLGVVLQSSDDVRTLEPILARLAIVALDFPTFSDGRAFSQATLLRQRLGYTGELRVIGHVLIDQIPLMLRTGFDSFEISHAPTLERLRVNRLPGIDLHYQPANDRTLTGQTYNWRRAAIATG